MLKESDKEERSLVVGKLLPKAYARSSVEGEEYERVWCQVLLEAVVDEAIRIKFKGWMT
jgi:hypothetical protein